MSHALTLVSNPENSPLTTSQLEAAGRVASDLGGTVRLVDWLHADIAADIHFEGIGPSLVKTAIKSLPDLSGLDFAVTPLNGRRKQVLVADMDSTMIEIETLDTLAAELGFGQKVAEITARSMNGELDFVESLRERVALLAGYPAEESMAVVMERVTFTPGAERTVKTMAAHGCYCALVSGGFTFTTEVVHKALGFQTHRANTLEIENGRFTGRLTGDIVSRPAKLETLDALCHDGGLSREQAACIGDGANDLDMLKAAGLGVGFHGKPIVRLEAPYLIDHTDMTTLLYYQGYRRQDFVV